MEVLQVLSSARMVALWFGLGLVVSSGCKTMQISEQDHQQLMQSLASSSQYHPSNSNRLVYQIQGGRPLQSQLQLPLQSHLPGPSSSNNNNNNDNNQHQSPQTTRKPWLPFGDSIHQSSTTTNNDYSHSNISKTSPAGHNTDSASTQAGGGRPEATKLIESSLVAPSRRQADCNQISGSAVRVQEGSGIGNTTTSIVGSGLAGQRQEPSPMDNLAASAATVTIDRIRRGSNGTRLADGSKSPTRTTGQDYEDGEEDDDDQEESDNIREQVQLGSPSSKDIKRDPKQERERQAKEPLYGNESVSLESSMAPPGYDELMDHNQQQQHQQHQSGSSADQYYDNDEEQQQQPNGSNSNNNDNYSAADEPESDGPQLQQEQQQQQLDEAAERREQEAAEASEAEAADRSALDEQQQQQRRIIMAQAQSEARAIRDQQEALLKQQQLQQQMLMRRHQSDLEHNQKLDQQPLGSLANDKRRRVSNSGGGGRDRASSMAQVARFRQKHQQLSLAATTNRQQGANGAHHQSNGRLQSDISANGQSQDSQDHADQMDQANELGQHQGKRPAMGYRQQRQQVSANANAMQFTTTQATPVQLESDNDEQLDVDYTIRKPTFSQLDPSQSPIAGPAPASLLSQQPQQQPLAPLSNEAQASATFAPQKLIGGSDLLPAAQHHHYGAHYGSLGGHHPHGGGHYYQFAESHKKGQFDSGFKRGGKKFHISGHSSQHKSHAEGHVKWKAKKGKGMQYWDYKHKGKKGHHHHHHY